MKHLLELEKGREAVDGRPSVGPVYRSAFAKDGFPPPVPGVDSCWDIFRLSAEKFPGRNMLGHRTVVDGKAGKYVWKTYKEVYDTVIKVGASIRSCGIEQESVATAAYRSSQITLGFQTFVVSVIHHAVRPF